MLLVNTPTLPPIGADTWIHVEVIKHLDRSRFDVHVACASGPPDAPAPMYTAVASLPDVHLQVVNFGREVSDLDRLGKIKQVVGIFPGS